MQTPYLVKLLHVEPSTYCNASCPQCERNINGGELNPLVPLKHLDLEEFREQLAQLPALEKVLFCGNRGDPLMNPHIVEMVRLCKDRGLTVGINTNGSIGNLEQWRSLGQLLNDVKDYCVFSIDGTEKTNHIYRRGVSWSALMRNVKEFISEGGRAHWDMLVFAHNAHEVKECETMAFMMGFAWFRVKETKRFKQPKQITAYGAVLEPVRWFPPTTKKGAVECMAQQDASIYLDAENNLYPCCWLASEESYTLERPYRSVDNPWPQLESEWAEHDALNVCVRTCAKWDGENRFVSQWKYEHEFNRLAAHCSRS